MSKEKLIIKTKYEGKCMYCNRKISKDEEVVWLKGIGISHLSCYEKKMKEKEEKKVVDQGKCEICGSDKVVVYRVSLGKANKVVVICDNCLHDLYNFAKSLS